MTTTLDPAKRLIRDCRDSPAEFARTLLRIEPTAQQREFLDAVRLPGARVAVRSGHGTGKSTALAMAALWFLSTRRDALVPCTAPTAHQLQDVLWREIRRLIARMDRTLQGQFRVGESRVAVAGSGGAIIARTARPENPDALQGFHAPEILFIIDEASGMNDAVFEVARGALSTPSARVALAGNPTRLSGYFHSAFHSARGSWTRLRFSCLESPIVSPDFAGDMAAEFGEDSDVYRVRVLGEFPKSGLLNLIPLDWVEAAMERRATPGSMDHAPKIIGLDVAWMGTDRTAAVLRQGMSARTLFTMRGADTVRVAEAAARKSDDLNPDAVFVDQTGVGAGVLDLLLRTRHPAIGVAFSGAPAEPERFLNKRAEIWWRLREWLEAGPVLERNDDLRDDLAAPEYVTTGSGKIQLESKDGMRKRGLASPDLGDALALTFAMPVNAHTRIDIPDAPDRGVYDPYEWMRRVAADSPR